MHFTHTRMCSIIWVHKSAYSTQQAKGLGMMYDFMDDYPAFISIKNASEVLGISERTVRKLIKEGKICSIKVGKLIRIPKKNFIDFLEKNAFKDSQSWIY